MSLHNYLLFVGASLALVAASARATRALGATFLGLGLKLAAERAPVLASP
jgi:hypothetical protein